MRNERKGNNRRFRRFFRERACIRWIASPGIKTTHSFRTFILPLNPLFSVLNYFNERSFISVTRNPKSKRSISLHSRLKFNHWILSQSFKPLLALERHPAKCTESNHVQTTFQVPWKECSLRSLQLLVTRLGTSNPNSHLMAVCLIASAVGSRRFHSVLIAAVPALRFWFQTILCQRLPLRYFVITIE